MAKLPNQGRAVPKGDDLFARLLASGGAAGLAEMLTLPTDVAKVRMQVQVQNVGVQYSGLADCLLSTARSEGPQALWKGLAPALVRVVSYTATAMVVYEPIRCSS